MWRFRKLKKSDIIEVKLKHVFREHRAPPNNAQVGSHIKGKPLHLFACLNVLLRFDLCNGLWRIHICTFYKKNK